MPSGAEPQPPFTELPVSRHKMVLLTWAGIYPTITLVLWLLLPTLLEYLPLPLMTLVVTGIVVPLMSYVVNAQFCEAQGGDPLRRRGIGELLQTPEP